MTIAQKAVYTKVKRIVKLACFKPILKKHLSENLPRISFLFPCPTDHKIKYNRKKKKHVEWTQYEPYTDIV